MTQQRADVRSLVERGFFASRAKAREAIEAGLVTTGRPHGGETLRARGGGRAPRGQRPLPLGVARRRQARGGARRLRHRPGGQAARSTSAPRPAASPMCFSHEARPMSTCIDVGHGQLHPVIAADRAMTSLEKRDARASRAADLPEAPQIVVCDVSFHLAVAGAAAGSRPRRATSGSGGVSSNRNSKRGRKCVKRALCATPRRSAALAKNSVSGENLGWRNSWRDSIADRRRRRQS